MLNFRKGEYSDNYKTPDETWVQLVNLLKNEKIHFETVWEPFYFNGECVLKNFFNTIHEDIDFFENNLGDVVISNPPYSIKSKVLDRLFELNKPFILLMPGHVISTKYYQKFLPKTSLLVPKKRIQFLEGNKCLFDTFFYCWNIFPTQIIKKLE